MSKNKPVGVKTPRELSWTPRLYQKGGLMHYCSPACGHGCTLEMYLLAKLKAEKLAAALGKNWEPRVWENCGWHYRERLVISDVAIAEVMQSAPRRFWISVIVDKRQFHLTQPTPKRAVAEVKRRMLAHAHALTEVAHSLQEKP